MTRHLLGAALVLLAAWTTPSAASDAPLPALARAEIAVGRFTQQRRLPELERPIVSRGRFAYHAERGLLWHVEEPVESVLLIDADGVYQDGQRVEGGRALAAVRPVFRGLFGGDLDALERHFALERRAADNGWRLRLLPRDETLAAAVESIVITGADAPTGLVIRAADGGRTELEFRDVSHPDRLGPELRRAFDRAR